MGLVCLCATGHAAGAQAQLCHREGTVVTCDDGRRHLG
jgi:hypothetical protein